MNVIGSMMGSRYVICGLGIALAYVIFAVLQVNHFVNILLKGNQYYVYYLTYLPALYVFFCLYSTRARSFGNVGWSLAFGAVAGYVVGLIAYFVVVFSMGDGFARIANSARDLKSSLIMLSAPLLYLSWAYGALAALSAYLIKRRAKGQAGQGPRGQGSGLAL